MRWRRSEKRPKWLKTAKRLNKIEDSTPFKTFRSEDSRHMKRQYHYRSLKIFKEETWKEPEPLVDVFREKDKIVVVAELKGFKRENIKVQAETQRLTLTAKAQGRKYHKSVNLPEAVVPKAARITYKNGVLEIQLKKALEERTLSKVAG
ncbi:MAG: Hsp20/alpha crystallin family protein [Candidatus Bathyarchaeia archaeon]